MVLAKISEFLGSDAPPTIGVIAGAGLTSALAGYVVDAMKWTGTDKAAWASIGVKILAGAALYGYSQGLVDKTSMSYVLARGAAMGSLVAIGITLWNRFLPFQLQIRADSSLLSVNPTTIGQRQVSVPLSSTVNQGGCGGSGGLKLTTAGQTRS